MMIYENFDSGKFGLTFSDSSSNVSSNVSSGSASPGNNKSPHSNEQSFKGKNLLAVARSRKPEIRTPQARTRATMLREPD